MEFENALFCLHINVGVGAYDSFVVLEAIRIFK